MKEIINAVIQGVIQGLSEFLPVSSSGHLALFQHFTGNSGEAGFLLSVVLHLGTLAAVFAAFWKTVITLVKEFFIMCADIFRTVFKMEGNKFSWKKMNGPRRMLVMVIISTAMIVPFYIAVKPFEEKFLVNPDPIVIGVCFLITS
ncbi:MAG: undecaprenyl-diphosphate phosphatase, partial [Oscillospiraceae bacterium]|nr:undecaprenyl-diphosphate phosphatase [Oscillospiraceae bacterium]